MSAQCGIYVIENLKNGKKYIGKSVYIKRRWGEHIRQLNANEHANDHLQAAWNKYGRESFSFRVQEYCERDVISEREMFWITHYRSHDPAYGYNLSYEIDGRGTVRYETIQRLKDSHKYQNVPVLQLDDIGAVIARYASATEAAIEYNTTSTAILNSSNYWDRQSGSKRHRGFTWVRERDYERVIHMWSDLFAQDKKNCLSVNMYSYPDGVFLDSYPSCVEAALANGLTADIVSLCVRGAQKHSGDKTFRRASECDGKNPISIAMPEKRKNPNMKAVCAIDRDGCIVGKYESIIAAGEALGKRGESAHISECCNGKRKTCHGLRWVYADQYQEVLT